MAKKLKPKLLRDEPVNPNQEIHLVLPFGVSVNSMYYANTRRQALTKQAKQWFHTAQYITKKEIGNQGWIFDYGDVWYLCEVRVYMKDLTKRDSHNYLKLMLDALEGLIYKNDYFVKPSITLVEMDRSRPRIEVIIKAEVA